MAARDDQGNSAKEEASLRAAARLLSKLGTRVEQLDHHIVDLAHDMPDITEIRFKIRYATVGDVLGVVKGVRDGKKLIAFHSDDTFGEVLVGLVNRMNNGTLKWKEDIPYEERGATTSDR